MRWMWGFLVSYDDGAGTSCSVFVSGKQVLWV